MEDLLKQYKAQIECLQSELSKKDLQIQKRDFLIQELFNVMVADLEVNLEL